MIDEGMLVNLHRDIHGSSPDWIARAPGRVNLIGEHVDYNGGFVLPAAIDREVRLVATGRGDQIIRVHSKEYNETFEFASDTLPTPGSVDGWQAYLVAVVSRFRERGLVIPGFDAVIAGDVPLGAGLSSSAAFSVCLATFLNALAGAGITPRDLALLAQEAEHCDYIGVKCGIMDQFISALGEEGTALLLDCHTLEYRHVSMDPSGAAIVIINSMKRRGLVDSEYNQRREECATALRLLSQWEGVEYPTLRHVPLEVFEKHATHLEDKTRRRARHGITENHRVMEFAEAAESGNWKRAGVALYESHASLRDDFEVSCRELDFLSAISEEISGVHGCRMTGAGFGGCAVALVEPDKADTAARQFQELFRAEFNVLPDVYQSIPGPGASARKVV